jgi:hypothetical protein
MKAIVSILGLALVLLWGCQSNEDVPAAPDSSLTGNAVTYELSAASLWDIHGTATFYERKDGSTLVALKLEGMDDSNLHPAHLHFGDITVDKAEIAVPLKSVDGATGTSNTIVRMLSDETPVTYEQLKNFDGCVKIHLAAEGDGANVILAGGNIGSAITKPDPLGRVQFGICKSQ